jgi:hypothetical protein
MFALKLPGSAAVVLLPLLSSGSPVGRVRQQIKKAKKYPANRCSLLANDVKHGLNTLARNRSNGAGGL